MKDPQNSLLKQYIALLKADGVDLVFTAEAVDKIAEIAYDVNQGTDNIGARRLATILENCLKKSYMKVLTWKWVRSPSLRLTLSKS